MSGIVCYVSGHGYGHATRVMEVLRALRRRRPDLPIAVRSPLPASFFAAGIGEPVPCAAARLDVGVIQADSLRLDPEATLRAYAAIAERQEEVLRAELDALAALAPALILADIPALPFAAARRLGVPGIAMGNFSWDWIYADYASEHPSLAFVVEELRRCYAQADLLLRLPMAGDLSAFATVRDLPFVARRAVLPAREVRERLGLPRRDRLVLLSFGGMGLTLDRLPPPPRGVTYLVSENTFAGAGALPGAYVVARNADLAARRVGYEDLIASCDAVITKPGYGIVSECLANRVRMIYTSRGRFAEYPIVVRAVEEHLTSAFLSNQALRAGDWDAVLEDVLSRPPKPLELAIDGASVAADILCEWL